jgi:hypothetical protein
MSALLITGLSDSIKEFVLTPWGNDMIPVLGPVVNISPKITLPHLALFPQLILLKSIQMSNMAVTQKFE